MKVAIAYSFVVFLWSTTPLAVKWSNSSLSFIAAVSLRMAIALVICLAIMAVSRRRLIEKKSDWLVFFVASLGLFPTMVLVYWATQFIPSGLIAVIFGLYPFMIGFFSLFILNENIFNTYRSIALVIATVGLIIINGEQLLLGYQSILAVSVAILAVFIFGFNSVWLKSIGSNMDPIRQVTGTLIVATPGFVVSWWVFDGTLPTTIDFKSALGVSYLSIAGSVLGQAAFFYVVAKCSVASVGIITLITPVTAMMISVFFAGESFSDWTFIGCGMIILALTVYQFRPGMLKVTKKQPCYEC